jgi:hypothetical protein
MPIKITKKSKKTKGKGKLSQSQQVIVNIQKGKRKSSSQPIIRQSQPPIIIQSPQQDFSIFEKLLNQYSTSRSVVEPVKQVATFETQTEIPIMIEREQQTQISLLPPKLPPILNEKNKEFLDTEQLKEAIDTNMVSERRIKTPSQKVLNPRSGKMIKVGTQYYKTLVKQGIIKPE